MAKKTTRRTQATADIGVFGLGVMGQNLILNIADHGYTVAAHSVVSKEVTGFARRIKNDNEPSADRARGITNLKAFVLSRRRPRKLIILVPVDPRACVRVHHRHVLLLEADVNVDQNAGEAARTAFRPLRCRLHRR